MKKNAACLLWLFAFVIYVFSQQEQPDKKADWEHIGWGKSDGTKIFARSKKIKLKNGNIEIWIKQVPMVVDNESEEVTINGKKYKNTIECNTCPYESTLLESNCDNHKIRIISIVKYSGKGEVISSNDREGEWFNPAPDSISEKVLNIACDK